MNDTVPLIGIDSSGSQYTLGSISYGGDTPLFLPVSDYRDWKGPLKFHSGCSLRSDGANGTMVQINVIGDSSRIIFEKEGFVVKRFRLAPHLLPAFDHLRGIYFHE